MEEFIKYIIKNSDYLLELMVQHLELSIFSVLAAIIVGIPIGITIARYNKFANITLNLISIIFTIPSIAMFGLMLPILGTGNLPAFIALFLYSLLTIVNNTYTGISSVDKGIIEAGKGMGMTNLQILFRIKFPLSLGVIFAGIRTAVVINVGITTIAAFIGAGGLGKMIFRGIYTVENKVILAGSLSIFLLAVILDYIGRIIEKRFSHSYQK
ncbi:MAG: ABC transporter permease [Eubacteriales bacterium]|jgi:osmoprotectant transport system permease protein|nr:ABC transporter permease [Eubacteriales bacterium]